LSDKIDKNEIGGACSKYGERVCLYRDLVGKPERKRPRRRLKRRWKYNVKWILRKWDVGDMDWICLRQDSNRWLALINAAINLRVP
jgi:hypothetical protein